MSSGAVRGHLRESPVTSLDRRAFLTTGAFVSTLGGLRARAAMPPSETAPDRSGDEDRTIWLSGDGLGLTPGQYACIGLVLYAVWGFATFKPPAPAAAKAPAKPAKAGAR